MKSSPDFQTGSILLLTATLICIGLAIAVVAPIIDSPLAASTDLRITPSERSDEVRTASSEKRSASHLHEFYPPIERAHLELDRNRQSTGQTAHRVNQTSDQSFEQRRVQTTVSYASNMVANSQGNGAVNDKSVSLPPGSVYAPITIQTPVAPAVSTAQSEGAIAERIERLVTERERLASALELEKQRHSQLAKQERRKRTQEQQEQIAGLERQLQQLTQTMADLQTETASHLNRITEDNQRLNMASETIDVYKEALRIANARATEALANQPKRTARVDRSIDAFPPQELRQDSGDDAGRVRIPELPPMPTHQNFEPQPPTPIPTPNPKPNPKPNPSEDETKSARAPMKRLRVSSPNEKPAEPERQPVFLPLPLAEPPATPAVRTPSDPSRIPDAPSSTDSEMKLTPLDAPKIREFRSSHLSGWEREFEAHASSRTQSQRSQSAQTKAAARRQSQTLQKRISTHTIPDLDVAYEHTYEFRSKPVDSTSGQTTQNIATTQSLKTEESRTVSQSRSSANESTQTSWQAELEAIEVTTLNSSPTLPPPRRLPSARNTKAATTIDSRSRMTAAKSDRAQRPHQPSQQAQRTSRTQQTNTVMAQQKPKQPAPKKSWIQRVSGVFKSPDPRRTTSHQIPKSARVQPLGGRGQNRHLQRRPVEQGQLKIAVPGSTLRSAQPSQNASSPPAQRPQKRTMLQRLSDTFSRKDNSRNQ